jgi:hypothetical protein
MAYFSYWARVPPAGGILLKALPPSSRGEVTDEMLHYWLAGESESLLQIFSQMRLIPHHGIWDRRKKFSIFICTVN